MQVRKQLSVFLKNAPGVLAKLSSDLADHEIDILGMTVSDTVDHAVVRLMVSNPDKAMDILESAGQLVVESEVLVLELSNRRGALEDLAERLSRARINIEYAYGTVGLREKKGVLIIRVSDIKRALKVLRA
ncbi:MAG: amino acid-binding protein [Candidatus Lindowbacteria bacterium RIFCSPLOWO2_12_FULL_62_27]|nr:MAG: amino acid-binding protein [Candidatus Lindowbacteria bacterium RIFCSPLOWO2_12_FULL_62_27]